MVFRVCVCVCVCVCVSFFKSQEVLRKQDQQIATKQSEAKMGKNEKKKGQLEKRAEKKFKAMDTDGAYVCECVKHKYVHIYARTRVHACLHAYIHTHA